MESFKKLSSNCCHKWLQFWRAACGSLLILNESLWKGGKGRWRDKKCRHQERLCTTFRKLVGNTHNKTTGLKHYLTPNQNSSYTIFHTLFAVLSCYSSAMTCWFHHGVTQMNSCRAAQSHIWRAWFNLVPSAMLWKHHGCIYGPSQKWLFLNKQGFPFLSMPSCRMLTINKEERSLKLSRRPSTAITGTKHWEKYQVDKDIPKGNSL